MDDIVVTDNFLIGLSRRPEIILRFPFIKQLGIKIAAHPKSGCGGCGAAAKADVSRRTVSMLTEVRRILATMQESEVKAFKELLDINSYKVTYTHRGNTATITR